MDCQEVKNIIPRYFQHTASEEEVKAVEEHLCICHECRLALGELMDKMEEAGKPVEPQNQEEEVHIIPESGESLEDVTSVPKKEEKPAPSGEPEKKEEEQEAEEAGNINEKNIAGPDEAVGKIGEEKAPEQKGGSEEQKPPAEEKKEEQPAEAEGKEEIEYIPGKNIEDISEEKEKTASSEDASIEEEIKPFFEEKSEVPAQEPEPAAQEEPVRDLGGQAPEGGVPEEEPVLEEETEQAQQPAEEAAPEFPEKFSLEGEGKVGLLEYSSLAVGLGILGFFIYLLLKG